MEEDAEAGSGIQQGLRPVCHQSGVEYSSRKGKVGLLADLLHITESWTPNPERLRDWISVPKSNGYESLHTTVVGPEGRWVEVQIRSRRMDEIAEKGLAAHWKYKGIKQDKGLDQWVSKVREILEAPETAAEDLVEQFQLNLYKKEVFAFTPTGDLKKLPHGATVLDFAFEIHSDVGCQCVGAKINGRSVPIKHTLSNGDVVEIKTSKNQNRMSG